MRVGLTLLRDVRLTGQLAMQRTSLVVCIRVRKGIHLGNTDPEPISVLVSDSNVWDSTRCRNFQDGHDAEAEMLLEAGVQKSNLLPHNRSTGLH